jgi:VanZ family protein
MLGYALLGMSLMRGQRQLSWQGYLLAVAGCTLYALGDEFHQSFVPGRNATLVDVAIDLTGCLIGLVVLSRVPFLQKVVLS